MMRRWFIALATLLLSFPAFADQSSYQIPLSGPKAFGGAGGVADEINHGFLAAVGCSSGSSAPANGPGSAPITYQCWADTSASPTNLRIYDGSNWVVALRVDTTNHAIQLAPTVAGSTTWTGQQIFNGLASLGAVQINTSGLNRGLIIQQTLSGTLTGAFGANGIQITSDKINDTSGFSGSGIYGWLVIDDVDTGANGSRNALGGQVALNVTGITTNGDLIGVQGYASATFPNGGSGGSPQGTLFGASLVGFAFTGATNYQIVTGTEFQRYIQTGASAQIGFGLTVAGNGNLQGGTYDAGIGFYSYTSAGAYKFGIEFTNIVGSNAPLASTATVFGTDGSADTVANFADFHTWTFTGNIMNFPNFVVTAAGTVAGITFQANGTNGVSCSGVNAGTVVVTGGIVTHC